MPLTNVLIVDDEERFLKTTQTLLEKEGYKVFTAADGYKGLDALKDRRIDVVVLDVKMPGMDGVEVLKRIKAEHPLVEVLMLTGHATMETAIDGLKLGAFDYLTKPCDIATLKEKIMAAYDKRSAMLEKIQKAKFDRIISHPMEVFSKDE
ncbi:sigma-54-dependent transcriptional regulator [Desulfatitalea tepidiphila]|uniref:sigma-54-dependent transcriptional regulator n=1 Tax=Desulfatitalea tepidiphila TaxID=1185843 RepID=UPI0006B54785|nr:response regulator [Desulfatitalea tepidiphila]